MTTASKYMTNTYEYMDETDIDNELKCTICTQLFQKPVSLSCQHTFCLQCIEHWLDENNSCPTCRQSPINNENEKFSPINTYIVNNQLDRLLVRCIQCQEMNIQRGNFPEHELKCLKKFISCPSSDIQCPWKGLRDELDIHLRTCPFQQIRPIINHLQTQLDTSLQIQNDLHGKLEIQSEQMNFLLAFINQGNTMNKECLKLYNRCQYSIRNPTKSKIIYHCTLCDSIIKRKYVALHACSLDEHIDCICQTCYEKQYTIPEETDDDEE